MASKSGEEEKTGEVTERRREAMTSEEVQTTGGVVSICLEEISKHGVCFRALGEHLNETLESGEAVPHPAELELECRLLDVY